MQCPKLFSLITVQHLQTLQVIIKINEGNAEKSSRLTSFYLKMTSVVSRFSILSLVNKLVRIFYMVHIIESSIYSTTENMSQLCIFPVILTASHLIFVLFCYPFYMVKNRIVKVNQPFYC